MIKLSEKDFHKHILKRMRERGVTRKEVEKILNEGIIEKDAKQGTLGKKMVFTFKKKWEDIYYEEKEVIVYYKLKNGEIILLTVIVRYGKFTNINK